FYLSRLIIQTASLENDGKLFDGNGDVTTVMKLLL
ncbi:hypothetical protein OKE_05067, partial [Enterococcus faecium EnGen0043]